MKVDSTQPKPEFELFKELANGVWIALRRRDPRGEHFLARRISEFDRLHQHLDAGGRLARDDRELLGLQDLLYEFNQGSAVAQILNHENLVSLVGHIRREPFVGARGKDRRLHEDYHVWDYCDAANLRVLLDDHPRTEDASYHLPESLCWHVLRSLTRAVLWLHDGKRLFFNAGQTVDSEKLHLAVDQDWLPILHRAIEPSNIYFQHPRGTETYGLCKLGNFSDISVTGHAVGAQGDGAGDDQPSSGVALTVQKGTKPLREIQRDMEKQVKAEDRPYGLSDELFSIGAVILTMMTGHTPISHCQKCGCSHSIHDADCIANEDTFSGHSLSEAPRQPCQHRCPETDINIDASLARARYTRWLRHAVHEMTVHKPGKKAAYSQALVHAQLVDHFYRKWREETEEGRAYTDLEDDMAARWRVKQQRESEHT